MKIEKKFYIYVQRHEIKWIKQTVENLLLKDNSCMKGLVIKQLIMALCVAYMLSKLVKQTIKIFGEFWKFTEIKRVFI